MKLGLSILSLIGIVTLAVACSSGGTSSSEESSTYKLMFKYVNGQVSGSSVGAASSNLPLVFGTIGVDAYYYRPGAGSVNTVDSNPSANNIDSDDWSQWDLLPWGSVSNIYVPPDSAQDLGALSTSDFNQRITDSFAAGVGVFSFDFIFLKGVPNIVMSDNTVCGPQFYHLYGSMTYQDIAALFPTLNIFQPSSTDYICAKIPHLDGNFLAGPGNVFTLVVRKDWFPTINEITYGTDSSGNRDCWTSATAMTATQIEMIDSLMAQVEGATTWPAGNYQTSACVPSGSADLNSFAIVPQTGDVPVIKFTESVVPTEPTITPDGNTIPQPPQIVIGSNLKATVSFNMTSSLVTNWADVSNPSYYCSMCSGGGFTAVNSQSTIQQSISNGAPWGISVEFEAVP